MSLVRGVLLFVLALTHLALGASSQSMVLCFEPGGRISIEHVGALCCDREESSVPGEQPAVETADCCACIDLALAGDPARPVVTTDASHLTQSLAMALPVSASPAPFVVALRGSRPFFAFDRDANGPPEARTSILRC